MKFKDIETDMDIKTGIYLSGSISHDPDFVRKFALAEKLIFEKADPGTAIFNPAANQTLPTEGKTEEELWADYLVRDLFMLMNIRQKFPVTMLCPEGYEGPATKNRKAPAWSGPSRTVSASASWTSGRSSPIGTSALPRNSEARNETI